MSTTSDQAAPAIEKLLRSDPEQLFEELGLRSSAIGRNVAVSAAFAPAFTAEDIKEMGDLAEARKLGQRIFRRWNREAYHLFCGNDPEDDKDRRALREAFGIGGLAVATTLSGLLVTSFGVSPAIAAVLAALVVKRFFQGAYQETCDFWKEKLA